MSQLASVALIIGGILALIGAGMIAVPGWVGEGIRRFPRTAWVGQILTTVDIAWVAVLVLAAHFSWIDQHTWVMYVAAPVAWILILVYVDELLPTRSLGGLLLLLAQPILDAAFVHESALRLVVTTFAYVLVVIGIVLVWSPYMFRKWLEPVIPKSNRCRLAGSGILLLGVVFCLLGLTVY